MLPEDSLSEVRQQILDAAESRYRTYGYRKTTMAEVAEDCGMSAANLYRYFESKQDIAAACATCCMDRRIEALREVIERRAGSASEQLESFVLEILRYTYKQTSDDPKINELVEYIANERTDIVLQRLDIERSLIAEILAQGNETGEFDVQDVDEMAKSIHAAIALFRVPIFMNMYLLEQFERKAIDVVGLLVRGLTKR